MLTLLAAAAVAAPAGDARLALNARLVLKKYCYKCHSKNGKSRRGDFNVLNNADLRSDRPRPLVGGGLAGSLLWELTDAGMMPPLRHDAPDADERKQLADWVRGGAPAFAESLDEQYVLDVIEADTRSKSDEFARRHRYVTLHEPLKDSLDDPKEFLTRRQKLRTELSDALGQLSPKHDAALAPIDSLGVIFRIDLKALGWDREIYVSEGDDRPPLNAFDVVLLEYPYGYMPLDHKVLVKGYLKSAGMVRPFPHIRADWLTRHLGENTWAARELSTLLGLREAVTGVRPESLRPAEPASETAGQFFPPIDGLAYSQAGPAGSAFGPKTVAFSEKNGAGGNLQGPYNLSVEPAVSFQAGGNLNFGGYVLGGGELFSRGRDRTPRIRDAAASIFRWPPQSEPFQVRLPDGLDRANYRVVFITSSGDLPPVTLYRSAREFDKKSLCRPVHLPGDRPFRLTNCRLHAKLFELRRPK